MRDYDFHPDEDSVRCFGVPDAGILVNDDGMCVMQTRQPEPSGTMDEELVLRHYAFADEWFKLNVTFDLRDEMIEPGPQGEAFAINCDIATPMLRVGDDVSAVDLFLDVLVRGDGTYRVIDRDEFEHATTEGLISQREAEGAEVGLERLVRWIESGRLHSLLREIDLALAATAPPPLPFERVPIGAVPSVAPGTRPTW
ncbi:DUF402 domain-containing protein [Brachybacterium sp. FME24]|uniref:DUF402 domain-containing protein n=1 Tax=Brachybacterium sp. FME24 TaxID=2742605 RepID=UPI0018670D79|nr:DUF402 domain-containing protein [Brachybacterium sp. FME24]